MEDNEREELLRELRGTQEMLAQVLQVIGEPVMIPKENIARSLPEGTEIKIDDDVQRDAFVFSLEVPDV